MADINVTMPNDLNTKSTSANGSISYAHCSALNELKNIVDTLDVGDSRTIELENKTLSLNDLTFASGNLLNKTYVVRTNTAGRNITGRPDDSNKVPFILEVESIEWNNEIDFTTKQTYYQVDDYNIYMRYCTSGIWSEWTTIDDAKYGAAGASLGLVKSGGDVTISDGIITIKDGLISNDKIADISGDKITSGTIDAGKTNIVNINASNITSGTINSELLGDGSIDSSKLSTDIHTSINNAGANASSAYNKAEQAESLANAAKMSADGKNTVYYQPTVPSGAQTNDIWFNTGSDNRMSVYDGTKWVEEQFGAGAISDNAINADKIANDVSEKLDTAFENAEMALGDSLEALNMSNQVNTVITNWCYDNDVTYINGSQIYTGTVTAHQIAANTITANEIAAGTITANEIMAGTITAESGVLAEACIKEAYIQDAAITNAKIAEVAIGEANIKDAAITTAKIANLAVTNANIADATIEDAKIKNLNAAKITAGYIDAARIQAGSLSITQFDQDVQTRMSTTEKDAQEALGTATTASKKASSLETSLEGFKTTVSETYTTKETLKDYSTTEQMNSAINAKAGEINLSVASTVSKTYDKVTSKGEQLIVNGNGMLGDNTNFSSWTFDGAQTNSSSGSFTMAAGVNNTLRTDEFFLINPCREYTLSVDAKSLKGIGRFYAFVDFYDVDKNVINVFNHMHNASSTTTLAKDLKKGDTVIYLTDSSGWSTTYAYGFYMMIWNYTNSFGYTYPAGTYSRNSITLPNSGSYLNSANINKTNHTITLSSAYAGDTIPKGTPVSQGGDGSTYKYLAANVTIPVEWTTYSGKIQGVDYSGGNVGNMFPPGTGYAKVGFLWNHQGSGNGEQLWITNVTLTDTTETGEINKNLDDLTERVEQAELKIEPDRIVSTVRNSTEYTNDLGEKVSTDEVISCINQTAESVTIQANKINLEGAITFRTFSSDLQEQIIDIRQSADDAQGTANTANTAASNAAKTATNYLNFSSAGLVVGDMTVSTLGRNVLIDSDGVDIRDNSTVLASFQSDKIELGKNSPSSAIKLCANVGTITAYDDPDSISGNSLRFSSSGNLAMDGYSMISLSAGQSQPGFFYLTKECASLAVPYLSMGGVLNSYSSQADVPSIKWTTMNKKNPYIGYASDQVDGTFVVGSLLGTNYASGLAIGGGSGNLLWKGARVATATDLASYSTTDHTHSYLPLSGGTMTGEIAVGQGDGYGVQLGTNGRINAGGTTYTVCGISSTSFLSGHSTYALTLRGSGTRPTYNGNNLALYSDVSLSTLGVTATTTELNYCDGVTSNIQTQLNGKMSTSPAYIEFAGSSSGTIHGGYIDFHHNKSTADYTSRIIESTSGILTVTGGLKVGTTLNVTDATILGSSLSVAGGMTVDGMFTMKNGIPIRWMNSSAEAVNILSLGTSDNLVIGAGAPGNTNIFNGSGSFVSWRVATDTATYKAHLIPGTTDKCTLGTASNRWHSVYASNTSIQTSDVREKENIYALNDIHSELFDKLRPVQFNYINDPGHISYGLIAQEVASAMDELGIGENELDLIHHDFWIDEETNESKESYGLAYNNLIAMLIHEVQKLKQEVAALKTA